MTDADRTGSIRCDTDVGPPLVLHPLARAGPGRPTLISHANGFHGRCYRALAEALGDAYDCVGVDHRGHGLTGLDPADRELAAASRSIDWRPLGTDVVAVARLLAPDGGLLGVGHSMGGAALLMAAHRDPGAFDRLVLFEPVAPPPIDGLDPDELPIVRAAQRRRADFESVEAAVANYAAKPPMSLMRPDVLAEYVDGGTRATPEGVTLRCTPDVEAAYFRGTHSHDAWDLLPEIEVPVLVVSGVVEPLAVSSWAEGIAERLPRGEFHDEADLTHFGPFSDPDRVAQIIDDWQPADRN